MLSAALSAAMAVLAVRRRRAPGAMMLALLMAMLGNWALLYALELASADLASKVFWAKAQYLFFVWAPFLWVIFVLRYTGRDVWLRPRNIILAAIIPAVTIGLAWTTEQHGLIYQQTSLDTSQAYSMLVLDYGPAFWVQGTYLYVLMFLGLILLVYTFQQSARIYRLQIALLAVAALVPLLGNIFYISRLSPWPNLDLTPFAFLISGALAVWSLFRYRFLDILPVARDVLIEGMDDAVIVLDDQQRIVDLNRAAQRLFGPKSRKALGQPADHLLSTWSDAPAIDPKTTSAHTELVLKDQEGQRYLDLRVSVLYEHQHKLTGWLLVLRDITERRQVELAEQEQRALTEALYEASATLTRFLSLDDVLDRILAEAETVVPHDSSNIMLIEDDKARIVRSRGYEERGLREWTKNVRLPIQATPNLRTMLESGEPLAISDTEAYPDWVQMPESDWIRSYAGAPIRARDEVIGFLNLDRAEPNSFSPRHARRLQAFADQAAVAIENARLYESLEEANIQLRSALQTRDEIIQNLSHELRTPLTLLMGYIELMGSEALGPLSDGQIEALQVMSQQGDRLHFMVTSLLALRTFEPSKLDLENMDLASWLRSSVEAWRFRLREASLQLLLDIPDQYLAIQGAPEYLDLVIGNLLDNAIKFSPNGGTIRITAQREGSSVLVKVTDQGIGISSERIDAIFERFVQVDGTATRRFGGIGIGLALCQEVIAAHGGQITAFSQGLGQGTTFSITLPLAPSLLDPAQTEAASSSAVA
jgi:PAS domain S-box-containing protein